MATPPPPTQTQRPRLSPTNNGNETSRHIPNLTADSIFGPSSQKDKMVHVTEKQQSAPWQVPVYQEFSGPSTNFIFSQPGSYNITMGQGTPPPYQAEYPYSLVARPRHNT